MILIRQRGSLEQLCECRLSSPSLLAGKFEEKCTAFLLAAISVKEEKKETNQKGFVQSFLQNISINRFV